MYQISNIKNSGIRLKVAILEVGIIIVVIFVFCVNVKLINGQSLTGTSGGFSIPTADLRSDRSVWFGYGFLNKKYRESYANKQRDFHLGYATLTFLPFAEVSLRVSYPDGLNDVGDKKYIGDRMISGRLKLVKETNYLPSVVLGLQGFFTTSDNGGASYFNSTYIVATKNLKPSSLFKNIGFTLGYGSDIVEARTHQFIGYFGGISITPEHFDFLELMLEYDAERWNAGARVTILRHIVVLAGFEGMDTFSGGISYRFRLP